MKYLVYFPVHEYITVEVEIDGTYEDNSEALLDAAYEVMGDDGPRLCFQCSGYDRKWSFDYDTSGLELSRVEEYDSGKLIFVDRHNDIIGQ